MISVYNNNAHDAFVQTAQWHSRGEALIFLPKALAVSNQLAIALFRTNIVIDEKWSAIWNNQI